MDVITAVIANATASWNMVAQITQQPYSHSNSNDDGCGGNWPQHQRRIIFPRQGTSVLRRRYAAVQPKNTSTNEDNTSMLLALGSSVSMGWLFEVLNNDNPLREWRVKYELMREDTQGTSLPLFYIAFAMFQEGMRLRLRYSSCLVITILMALVVMAWNCYRWLQWGLPMK